MKYEKNIYKQNMHISIQIKWINIFSTVSLWCMNAQEGNSILRTKETFNSNCF